MNYQDDNPRHLRAIVAFLGVWLLAASGCGGDDGGETKPEPDGGTVADSEADGGDKNDGPPAVLVAERVFSPDGRSYFVSVVSEVPDGPLDRSKALEFQSADVEIFEDWVFIRDREANTMTRYTISDDLELVEEDEFSFQPTGLASGRVRSAYLSATQAYALDPNEWRMIEWNPKKMELTGEEVSLADLAKEDLPDGWIGVPVQVGDRVIAAVTWDDYDNLVTNPGSGALILEPDEEPILVESDQIGGVWAVYEGEDGHAYLGGGAVGDVVLFGSALGGGELPPSGFLRIRDGAEEFDPDYKVELETITGSPIIGGVHRLDERTVLVQIWDPETPTDTLEDPSEFWAAEELMYVLIDTEEESWERVESLPKGGTGNAGNHIVDGTLYINLVGEEGSTVYPVTPDGVGKAAFEVPAGDLWHLERVR